MKQVAANGSQVRQADSASQARRILEAWEQENMPVLRSELRVAQRPDGAASAEEEERLDLLSAIAAQMEQDLKTAKFGTEGGPSACFRLLEHLARKRPQMITRSGKPSSFPYSQSALKISACH